MKSLKPFALILILSGTAGLLLNEFLLYWGRSVTLIFAGISILGFAILGIVHFLKQKIVAGKNT